MFKLQKKVNKFCIIKFKKKRKKYVILYEKEKLIQKNFQAAKSK